MTRLGSRVLALLLVAAALVAWTPGRVAGFQGFDLSRWRSDGLIRVIEAGRLFLGLDVRGTTGAARTEANDLQFVNPNSITEVEADVTLIDVIVPHPDAGSSQAGIAGFWYWDGTGTGGPTDQTGHVFAQLVIDADEITQTVDVRFSALKCPDSSCAFTTTDVLTEVVLLTGVKRFETHNLRLAYDSGTGTFTFQLDGGAPQTFVAPDATRNTPTVNARSLRVRVRTEDSATARGRMVALFDNVRANGAAYDSFDDTSGAPRATLFPGTGSYPSSFIGDVVILVRSGTDAVTGGRLFLDGVDVTAAALAIALIEPLAGGGVAVRFPGIALASLVPPGSAKRVDAEVDTASGAKLRTSATWQVFSVIE